MEARQLRVDNQEKRVKSREKKADHLVSFIWDSPTEPTSILGLVLRTGSLLKSPLPLPSVLPFLYLTNTTQLPLSAVLPTHLSEPEVLTLPGSRGGPGPRCTRAAGPQGDASFPVA